MRPARSIGGLPGGFAAARLGARRAVIVGLTAMGLASVGFALAGGFWTLFAARLLQGAGSAFTWAGAFGWLLAAAPRERRGALHRQRDGRGDLRRALRAGDRRGGRARRARRRSSARSPGSRPCLVVWTLRLDSPPPGEQPSGAALVRAFRNRQFAGGLALMAVPSLLFGVLSVLGPLHLSHAGWGAAAIGGVWLVGAALEAVQAPLVGRLMDRRGRLLPVRVSLAAGAVLVARARSRRRGRSLRAARSCSRRWRTACCSRPRSR